MKWWYYLFCCFHGRICTTSPSFPFTYRLLSIISTHKNCLELFLPAQFYFEKFLTWIRRLPFAVYVKLELSIQPFFVTQVDSCYWPKVSQPVKTRLTVWYRLYISKRTCVSLKRINKFFVSCAFWRYWMYALWRLCDLPGKVWFPFSRSQTLHFLFRDCRARVWK